MASLKFINFSTRRLSHAGQTEISRPGDWLVLGWRLSPRGTRRRYDRRNFRLVLRFGNEQSGDVMSGAGAGVEVRICVGLEPGLW